MSRLLEALCSGRVLLMDGAMGTQLLAAGLSPEGGLERANLTYLERVAKVHRDYVAAGAEVLLTNTFQAFPGVLRRHGLADRLGDIVRAAVALARDAIGDSGFVLGDLGPGEIDSAELLGLLTHFDGIDGYMIETASDTSLLEHITKVLEVESQLAPPILFSATYLSPNEGMQTIAGLTPREIARRAAELGAAAIGVNCGRDMDVRSCARVLEQYREETTLPLFARPNAGTPRMEEGSWIYPMTPQVMAREAAMWIDAGATMIGGCCGTTPEHIAQTGEIIRAHNQSTTTK